MSTSIEAFLEDYFTEEQLAAALGKTVRALRDWRTRRYGPPWAKIGETVIYHKPKTRQWLQEIEQQPLRPMGRRRRAAAEVRP
jgi:hypothetical protein